MGALIVTAVMNFIFVGYPAFPLEPSLGVCLDLQVLWGFETLWNGGRNGADLAFCKSPQALTLTILASNQSNFLWVLIH